MRVIFCLRLFEDRAPFESVHIFYRNISTQDIFLGSHYSHQQVILKINIIYMIYFMTHMRQLKIRKVLWNTPKSMCKIYFHMMAYAFYWHAPKSKNLMVPFDWFLFFFFWYSTHLFADINMGFVRHRIWQNEVC